MEHSESKDNFHPTQVWLVPRQTVVERHGVIICPGSPGARRITSLGNIEKTCFILKPRQGQGLCKNPVLIQLPELKNSEVGEQVEKMVFTAVTRNVSMELRWGKILNESRWLQAPVEIAEVPGAHPEHPCQKGHTLANPFVHSPFCLCCSQLVGPWLVQRAQLGLCCASLSS